MTTYSILFDAKLSASTSNILVGDVLVKELSGGVLTGKYVKSTTANRGTRRSTGIALTPGDSTNRAVNIQLTGEVSNAITNLGAGSVSWVRVSTTGHLERCTPASGDDIIGKCDAYGTLTLDPGVWDENNTAGGGGSVTPGGSDGDIQINDAGTGLSGLSPGTSGNIVQSNGTDWTSVAPSFAGSVITSGTVSKTYQEAQDMGGDVTGTTAAAVVAKVNGIACSGTPAAGAVLRATSASAAAWGQVDLADTDAVTGTLPTGNQASQSMGGDCSGTTASCTVAKVNGATVPAAGALTTGNAAYVSGVSALTYSALNLAGGSGWITGTLPVGNGGTGITSFGTGVATWLGTPSGVNLASALTTALPNTKGGTGQDSSAWTGLANVTAGTWASLALGTGVATWLGTPSSANLASAITDETGSGALVFATSPLLVTPTIADSAGGQKYVFAVSNLTADRTVTLPLLGADDEFVFKAFAQTLTNKTIDGASNTLTARIANDVSGLGTGVATFLGTPSGANLASALTSSLPNTKGGTGQDSSAWGGVVKVTAGTWSSFTLGSGVETMLGTFSSANIKSACTDETGTGGALVFATSPTLTTPQIDGGRAELDSFRVKGETTISTTGTKNNTTRAAIIRITTDNVVITGVDATGAEHGELLEIWSTTTLTTGITITHQDTNSTATNRFINPNSATLNLNENAVHQFRYDATTQRWRACYSPF